MNILTNGNGTIDFGGMADNIKEGLIGFLSSAMITLQWANMFIIDKFPLTCFHH